MKVIFTNHFKLTAEIVLKLIVGLGNPGPKYSRTRHNAGFMALEHYLDNYPGLDSGAFKDEKRFKSQVAVLGTGEEKVILLKPQTFMNDSGRSVRAAVDYYSLEPSDVLVIYDELALPFGTIRARQGGESAGHNGIKSIINHYGRDFNRLRIGIANEFTDKHPADKFVLSDFSRDEQEKLPEILNIAGECIEKFIKGGLPPETYKSTEN